jgi:hypothetical protein
MLAVVTEQELEQCDCEREAAARGHVGSIGSAAAALDP